MMRPRIFCSILAVTLLGILSSVFSTSAYAATRAIGDQIHLTHSIPLYKDAIRLGSGDPLPCLESQKIPLCYSPQQMRRAYDIQPLLKRGITGKGRTIIIVDDYQSPTLTTDLRLFDKIFGLKDPQLNIIAPFGLHPYDFRNGAAISFAVEISLDVEWAHAIAPDATIDLVLGNPADDSIKGQIDAIIDATKYAVDNDLGSVMSLSVGIGETCYSSAELQAWHQAFAKAKDQGITVFASSGDIGSAAAFCNRAGVPVAIGKGVDYPGSDPLLSSVGGTSLFVSQKGEYLRETTWNESKTRSDGAGGGGFSSLFSRPSYQDGIPGIGSARGVPDVAYNGDPFTGVPVVISSILANITIILPVGGTSAGAPQWAGIVALLDQDAGKRLGFLNDAFYNSSKNSSYAESFYDVTAGDNAFTFKDDRGNTVTIPGYTAGTGWDPVTGVGSPKAAGLSSLLENS